MINALFIMPKNKSWREYINGVESKIHEITPEWEAKLGKGKILIPSPVDIEKLILLTQSGQLITIDGIRERLAVEANVRLTAAAPTGIYLKHIALTAEEESKEGIECITPYWRVLKPGGLVNDKFPGGWERQIDLLAGEGHLIEYVGKRKKVPKVVSYENVLAFS